MGRVELDNQDRLSIARRSVYNRKQYHTGPTVQLGSAPVLVGGPEELPPTDVPRLPGGRRGRGLTGPVLLGGPVELPPVILRT